MDTNTNGQTQLLWAHKTRPDNITGLAALLDANRIAPLVLPNAYSILGELEKNLNYKVAIASLRLSVGLEPENPAKHDPVIENIMHHYNGSKSPRTEGEHYLCGIGVYIISRLIPKVGSVIVVTSHGLEDDNVFPNAAARLKDMGVKEVFNTNNLLVNRLVGAVLTYSR